MKLVAGAQDRLCSNCPGGLTKMERLPYTNTWMCPICSGLSYYTAADTSREEWTTATEEEQIEK